MINAQMKFRIENINDNSLLINADIPYKIEIETKFDKILQRSNIRF